MTIEFDTIVRDPVGLSDSEEIAAHIVAQADFQPRDEQGPRPGWHVHIQQVIVRDLRLGQDRNLRSAMPDSEIDTLRAEVIERAQASRLSDQ